MDVSVADGVAVSVAVGVLVAVSVAVPEGEGVKVSVGVSLRNTVGVSLAVSVGVGVGPILRNGLSNRPEQKHRVASSAAPAINNLRLLLIPAFCASYFF